jgi:ribonuclease-3
VGLLIMSKNSTVLQDCQERLDYEFRDESLLKIALTHASSANSRRDSNERLEFLGDAVLDLVICQDLYERLPNALEGDLTKIKSAVVSRRVCARVADQLRLPEALTLGQGMEPDDHLPRSLAAAVFESVVAAIYLDGGLEAARKFILTRMAEEIRTATHSDYHYNFKSQLQQYAQRRLRATPVYELLDEKGPDHAKCFEIAVTVGAQQFSSAWGPNKKEAEQKAAWLALRELGAVTGEFPELQTDIESPMG